MKRYIFQYTNGEVYYLWFDTRKEANDYAHMEGDHLMSFEEDTES